MQVRALTEMQASCHVDTFGNYYHTATFFCCLVDERLDLGGVYASVGKDAIVGKDILFSKFFPLSLTSKPAIRDGLTIHFENYLAPHYQGKVRSLFMYIIYFA